MCSLLKYRKPNKMKTRVFLVDDHRILRDGLRILLDAQDDFVVVGEADTGYQLMEKIPFARPEIVIMDITLPGMNGIDITRHALAQMPELQVLILSVHSDFEHVFRAFQAGASGYLLKESAGSELLEALRAVRAGQRYISHKIALSYAEYAARRAQFHPNGKL